MKTLLIGLSAMLFAATASAEEPKRDRDEHECAQGAFDLLIIGTYHMDNPGLDAINIEADDVLAPHRQTELTALNSALAQFGPTKIAVEGDRSRSTWPDRYRAWIAGDYKLGRNEIEQIGMKVARSLGHSTIYPIDFPMMMSGLRYDEVAPRPAPGEGSVPRGQRPLTEAEQLLRRSTIGENLRRANDPAAIAADHLAYMELLEPDAESLALYARSDLLLNWYKRNIRMTANLARIAEPGDRIMLLVGSGHLAIMRRFAIDSPRFCLADTLHYLPSRTGAN